MDLRTEEQRADSEARRRTLASEGDASLADTIQDPARLAALRATGLLDTEVEEVFDRMTRLAVKLLNVPAAFISLVDDNRDFYKSAAGFGEPLQSDRQLTGRTFCHYAIQSSAPLVIDDAAAHPVYRNVPTVQSLGVGAYVGVPLVMDDGQAIGSFCAIDNKARRWTPVEVEALTELASSAKREIELRLITRAERTARLAAESEKRAAEESNRSKSAFLAMMSHELRTPLNAIGGYADLIDFGIHGPVTAAQSEALGRIKSSATHLLGLINSVLDFARVESGQIRYNISPIMLAAALRESESMVLPQMLERNLRYRNEGCDPTLVALADVEKVKQIVLNLLTNSTKFTDSGGEICMSCGTAGETSCFVRVEDTGAGIELSKLESIFEPFVQLEPQRGRRNEGVGLGLAISRAFARNMGGDLVAESTLGVGTTMTLLLPRA
jgi:signal transduction histidine kinase